MANFNPVWSIQKIHVQSIQFDFMPVLNWICLTEKSDSVSFTGILMINSLFLILRNSNFLLAWKSSSLRTFFN